MAILKDLIVHGSSRFLNKIYASEIQTPLIEAESGIIKKLKADDVTVVGLLDVKGQLHTNSWSNSNIATIDGSFYITPTIGSDSGTVSITSSFLTFSGTNYAVSSLYLGDGSSITWPQYSKVLITGQVLINGEWIPLGTLLGQIRGTPNSASISIDNIKDNKNQTSNVYTTLVNSGVSSTDYRNLKISLYQRAASQTDFRPLGIYMTAIGTNGRTFLDIYGGVESLSNSNNYGGFAEPNVRIGNLQGLPNVGGQTPSGWGIYTDNGYFKGIIAADKGYIGSGSRYWVIANYEDDSNPNNSRSYIYSYNGTDNGTDSVTSTVEGIYLGTDGIRNYKDSTHHVTIKNGVITALGVNLTGTINATAGNIGGASITDGVLSVPVANISGTLTASQVDVPGIITAGSIVTNTLQGGTFNTTDYIRVSTQASSALTIGTSGSKTDWRILAGKTFGVDKAGNMYATSATISGNITATSLSTGTKTTSTTGKGTYIDGSGNIYVGNGSINNFTVTDTGTITATGANLLTATIGNATNKISIGTGTSGHSSIRYGMTALADTSHDGFYIGTDGIALGKGKFKVTAAGAITATSLSIEISQVTDLQTTLNGKQAVGYITDMSNNGVFVHEKSNSPITPTSSTANGVQITSNVDIIRGGKSVAQYGTNARIGEADKGRLVVTNSDVTVYGIKNEEALSFGSTNNATSGSSIVTEYLQIFEQEDNGNTIFGAMTSYKISTILHCYKNGDETLPITMNIDEGVEQDYVYTNTGLSQYDYIEIQYRTNSQISYFKIGNTSSSSGGNSFAMGNRCKSLGANSLAIGDYSKAYGKNSVSLGNNNKTMAENSFSVGQNNIVKGEASAAAGDKNIINEVAWFSFAAGADNTITDSCGIALGIENTSSGAASIATGKGTIASGQSSFTCGQYNIQNSNVSFAVGNGTESSDRSDAFWVSNVGNIGFTGIAYAGQPTGADRVPLFATGTGTAQITINGNTTSPIAQSINIAKTGYTPWAINGIDITSPSCNLYRYFIEGNKLYYRLHNTSSSSVTVTITARISYIATSALSSS